MSTFIKTGFWETNKERKLGWLNLDELILKVAGPPGAGAVVSYGTDSIISSTPPAGVGVPSTISDAIFLGREAGNSANSANNSVFLGSLAGKDATSAAGSVFIGFGAGSEAPTAEQSNFIGFFAGSGAVDAFGSNFIGTTAGKNATNAEGSVFIGDRAGELATNASKSTFIGTNTGLAAADASKSIFIGWNVGKTFAGNNVGTNNIIIGTNISLPNNSANRLNIGGILFGVNTYPTTTGNPSVIAQPNGRIGIGVELPTAVLHLAPSATAAAMMRLTVGPAPTAPNDGDVWLESNTNTGLKIRLNGVTKTISVV